MRSRWGFYWWMLHLWLGERGMILYFNSGREEFDFNSESIAIVCFDHYCPFVLVLCDLWEIILLKPENTFHMLLMLKASRWSYELLRQQTRNACLEIISSYNHFWNVKLLWSRVLLVSSRRSMHECHEKVKTRNSWVDWRDKWQYTIQINNVCALTAICVQAYMFGKTRNRLALNSWFEKHRFWSDKFLNKDMLGAGIFLRTYEAQVRISFFCSPLLPSLNPCYQKLTSCLL